MELPLYHRQGKALMRMQAIEDGKVEFNEEERSEHILNGVGWCLIGRASKMSALKGGVLGDAIGSGKTVVTIALILSGIKEARASRCMADGMSGATLIVVPPGLVKQWDDERKKFTKNKLKSIILDSTDTLKRFSVKEMCEADIVIVPAGIIEERGGSATARPYTEIMSRKAGAQVIPPAPANGHKEAPTIEGTWVRNMASGPAIYVGNTGKRKHLRLKEPGFETWRRVRPFTLAIQENRSTVTSMPSMVIAIQKQLRNSVKRSLASQRGVSRLSGLPGTELLWTNVMSVLYPQRNRIRRVGPVISRCKLAEEQGSSLGSAALILLLVHCWRKKPFGV